jgi:cobalt/nickel transport system permease protein
LAAFVLAAQAVNLPAAAGASTHMIGAGLLALCVGPARAILALFAVLTVQALLFADGGITTLFVNLVNMAVLPVGCVHLARRWCAPSVGLGLAAGLGTALGSTLGALSLATLLVLGAGAPAETTFAWLVGIQSIGGVVEGTLTALALRYLRRRAPSLLTATPNRQLRALDERVSDGVDSGGWQGYALATLLAGAGILIALAPLASTLPDPLEIVVEQLRAR